VTLPCGEAGGFSPHEVSLTGGGKTNSSFMKKGLVDEIIFDVEPFALGNGIPVFAPQDFGYRLKLLKVKRLHRGILQLHYKVLK
jgi:riboflavin biosynthesis pyrimidine reductase